MLPWQNGSCAFVGRQEVTGSEHWPLFGPKELCFLLEKGRQLSTISSYPSSMERAHGAASEGSTVRTLVHSRSLNMSSTNTEPLSRLPLFCFL